MNLPGAQDERKHDHKGDRGICRALRPACQLGRGQAWGDREEERGCGEDNKALDRTF